MIEQEIVDIINLHCYADEDGYVRGERQAANAILYMIYDHLERCIFADLFEGTTNKFGLKSQVEAQP